MTDIVRRLVSGDKTRFRDPHLDLELDLAYVTDQVIVMGYPSVGLEGLYRNRREDAQRFLTSRHGSNFWVFNFCPTKENSYDSCVFGGRVSRYPFPDHHVPPLAILPLVSREIHAWVTASKDRVAVLHCKAGKGRSGMLACAYLLSLDTFPSPSSMENTYFEKDWISIHIDDGMQVISNDGTPEELNEGAVSPALSITNESFPQTSEEGRSTPAEPSTPELQQVLDWHTSRRMKASPISTKTSGSKGKSGISIPSQRRWLLYWLRLLAGQGPPGMWGLPGARPDSYSFRRKIRINEVSLRIRGLSGIKSGFVRVAGMLIDRGKDRRNPVGLDNNRVWASLARYDDEMVSAVEHQERDTRDGIRLGRRKQSSELADDIFSSDKWDKGKMVRTFGRMNAIQKLQLEPNGADEVYRHVLRPLTEECWTEIREARDQEEEHEVYSSGTSVAISKIASSEMTPIHRESQLNEQSGIIVDSDRELRIKLYMGQVIMGWMWLIPSFHMAPETPSSSIMLSREELDFPIGIGKDILDVEVEMEWCRDETDNDQQVQTMPSDESSSEMKTVLASVAGDVEVAQAVD